MNADTNWTVKNIIQNKNKIMISVNSSVENKQRSYM